MIFDIHSVVFFYYQICLMIYPFATIQIGLFGHFDSSTNKITYMVHTQLLTAISQEKTLAIVAKKATKLQFNTNPMKRSYLKSIEVNVSVVLFFFIKIDNDDNNDSIEIIVIIVCLFILFLIIINILLLLQIFSI